jgi:hypothetical protein
MREGVERFDFWFMISKIEWVGQKICGKTFFPLSNSLNQPMFATLQANIFYLFI